MFWEFSTRFNIGDTIYTADYYEGWYARKQPCIVTDIIITANSKTARLLYKVKQEDVIDSIPDKLAFATYEKCTKWCDKHN